MNSQETVLINLETNQILIQVMELINEQSFLYFFSSLAQCAAGFCALVGVFAVFRLQANAININESYDAARAWLRVAHSLNNTSTFTRTTVRKELQEIINRLSGRTEAIDVLEKIKLNEKFDFDLIYHCQWPLKAWGLIFIISLGCLPFAQYLTKSNSSALFVAIGFIISIAISLYGTAKFVQRCMTFDQ